jgi:hypothetical protein
MKKKKIHSSNKMVTRKDLDDLDFNSARGNPNEYFLLGFDYMYNFVTKEFYDYNDGFGEPTLLTKIKDIDHLKDVMESLNIN